jgi:hypothetical protein
MARALSKRTGAPKAPGTAGPKAPVPAAAPAPAKVAAPSAEMQRDLLAAKQATDAGNHKAAVTAYTTIMKVRSVQYSVCLKHKLLRFVGLLLVLWLQF